MFKKLITIANELDKKGLRKEADYLDAAIEKYSQDESQKAMEKVNYQVRKGDSWSRMTSEHSPGRTPEENAALNDMTIDDIIHPCQMLKLWSIPGYEGGANNMNCLED